MVPKSARRNRMVTSRLVKQGFRYDKLCGSLHITMLQCLEPVSNNIHIQDGIGLPICSSSPD